MDKPGDLINKRIAVPVTNFRRFDQPEVTAYTFRKKDGQVELKPSVLKKIKYRLEHESDTKS